MQFTACAFSWPSLVPSTFRSSRIPGEDCLVSPRRRLPPGGRAPPQGGPSARPKAKDDHLRSAEAAPNGVDTILVIVWYCCLVRAIHARAPFRHRVGVNVKHTVYRTIKQPEITKINHNRCLLGDEFPRGESRPNTYTIKNTMNEQTKESDIKVS